MIRLLVSNKAEVTQVPLSEGLMGIEYNGVVYFFNNGTITTYTKEEFAKMLVGLLLLDNDNERP